jgi:uncharacterized protein (TIGR03083 family)
MQITDSPAVDVRGPLTDQRERLLGLLAGLSVRQWNAPTVAPEWSVKDIVLHLIDVDLSWVARFRDHDQSGGIPESSGHEEFVDGLAQRNQRWVEGARTLSPRLIVDLLRWSGAQLDTSLAPLDLAVPATVYWAGAVPLWFDLAREFTERWVHFQQIRDAVGPTRPDQPSPDQHSAGQQSPGQDDYLALVIRTFIWGFPHPYRTPAPAGTAIGLEVDGVGVWTLTRSVTEWVLDVGQPVTPAAGLRASGDAAWRLLTGAPYDAGQVRLSGDPVLAQPLLQVRGIIV